MKPKGFAPMQCHQCFKIGQQLEGGRCSACRHRTPTELFNEFRMVRINAFTDPKTRTPLVTRLCSAVELNAIIAEHEESTRVEMQGGRTMESFRRGDEMVMRYTFPVVAENNPYRQTAEELMQHELRPVHSE